MPSFAAAFVKLRCARRPGTRGGHRGCRAAFIAPDHKSFRIIAASRKCAGWHAVLSRAAIRGAPAMHRLRIRAQACARPAGTACQATVPSVDFVCDPSNFPEQHEDTMNEQHLSGFIERLRRSWRRSWHRRRALDELAACPPSELKRMAADVGVSGEELYRLARFADGPSELLPQRLELLGIDAQYVRQAMPTHSAILPASAPPARRRTVAGATWPAAMSRPGR